jgi:2-keto-4-pentenoate hydratase/2-oxohepta-3-ene-1,7-dioic acid hydratase in catechol pathway
VLAPIPLDPAPSIWCIGLNYMKHWEEGAKKRGQPLPKIPSSFMKPASAISCPGQPIWVPHPGDANDRFSLGAGAGLNAHVDYEGELAIVIGKACRNVSEAEVLSGGYILGYTAANDVTQRHWQRNSGGDQWGRGKSLDTYCPMGPCLLLAGLQSPDLQISTLVNGEVRQHSRTSDMIFNVSAVVSWLSRATTLVPGTVILTGTPSGVGYAREGGPSWLAEGDEVQVCIEDIGCLNNSVTSEPQ